MVLKHVILFFWKFFDISLFFLPTFLPLDHLTEQCMDPGDPVNGYKKHANYTKGGTIEFACNKSYSLKGRKSINCMEGGKWSDEMPACHKGMFSKNLHLFSFPEREYLCSQLILSMQSEPGILYCWLWFWSAHLSAPHTVLRTDDTIS